MKRLVTTLVILLVVIVAGMTSLVFLINPNDFRDYMVNRVEQKSGYQLTIDGDLRWHVWPQLSILAGQTSITAPGAKAPVVSADNMRLDVRLLPLLSHQLSIKQVLLKSAVIRLTPDSEANEPDAPIAPANTENQNIVDSSNGWKFDIGRLSISDSLLIWQRGKSDPINVRDLNLQMDQDDHRQATLQLSSRINRDQRDLTLNAKATLNLQNYPHQFSANISNLTYQLSGADIPAKGISGEGSLQASYLQSNNTLSLSQLALSANNSQLTGSGSAILDNLPVYQLSLQSDNMDFDAISGWQPNLNDSTQQKSQAVTSAPVIARDIDDQQNGLSILNAFNAQLALKAGNVTYRGLKIQNFNLQAINHSGQVQLSTLSGGMGKGNFSLPGTLNASGDQLLVKLEPTVNDIELGDLLRAYDLPQVLNGSFSMQGTMKGVGLSLEDFNTRWQGDAQMSMTDARLNGLNIQQLVQQAVARSNNRVQGQQQYDIFSEIKKMQAHGQLNQGVLNLSDLQADSAMMAVRGGGEVNFPQQQADMNLLVKILGGWQGDNDLITSLQNSEIPLHVFGPWRQLNYELKVDQILRQQLQQGAKSAIQNWLDKNKDSKENKELKNLINK
ncbi:MAG: outer membrane assembly protein AsmA [Rouxiella aceris]|uniref:outer membrane assembly protein AsmA n=1 Tax=Rouxiella aceris TaxID=2703884 RepID=UPI0028442597|nr:outer membrane assembly protein AsmA [Rouxiella aceris]MDR3432629.1 outer membrane assembly protein AsmA [Rouxiella aceris]